MKLLYIPRHDSGELNYSMAASVPTALLNHDWAWVAFTLTEQVR